MADTSRLLEELAILFRDVLDAQNRGASTRNLGRSHGYVDGYMKALADSGLVSQKELLAVVAKVRAEAHGPAVKNVGRDANSIAEESAVA